MTGRILVVDDEPGMRLLGRMMLEERGLEVDVAASGQEALERSDAERYAAVVLDYKMPGMTGLDVLRELRARGNATPVVIYSGYLDPRIVEDAHAHDAQMVDKTETERLVALLTDLVTPSA